jgi:hypothetical protein
MKNEIATNLGSVFEITRHRRGTDNADGSFSRVFGIIADEPFEYDAVARTLEPKLLGLACYEWGLGFPKGTVRCGKPEVSDPDAAGVRTIRYTFVLESDEPIVVNG